MFLSFILVPFYIDAQSFFITDGIRYRVVQDADESVSTGLAHVAPMENGEYEGNVIIPNAVRNGTDTFADVYKVVGIDDKAFSGCYDLESVTLPVSIESIGQYAFQNSPSLQTVSIPYGNLLSIGDWSFAQSSIRSIDLPETIKTVGEGAFYSCENLRSIMLPDGLESIGRLAFGECKELGSIQLPPSLKTIGDICFSGSGIETISFPEGTRLIPMSVCQDCSKLVSVYLPESVREIGLGAFSICTSLENINLPERLMKIGMSAFSSAGLCEIIIPGSVKEIPDGCFAACQQLASVSVLNGVESIGSGAFTVCTALKTIELPPSLKKIGSGCFAQSGLAELTLPSSQIEIEEDAFDSCPNLKEVIVHLPGGTANPYPDKGLFRVIYD